MNPDFRSSNIEPEAESVLNPHAHRGAASITKLLAVDPMSKRLSTKKTVRQLTASALTRSPPAAHALEIWKSRWLVFEKEILGHQWALFFHADLTLMHSVTNLYTTRSPQVPTGEDLQRFLVSVPDMITPHGPLHMDKVSACSIPCTGMALVFRGAGVGKASSQTSATSYRCMGYSKDSL